jgi:hypothetical protein
MEEQMKIKKMTDAKQEEITQGNETGQNPVSATTVKSIRLNDGEKALAKKDKDSKRKAYLKSLEADAQTFVKGFQTAKAINDEANVLHRKFKDVVEEMRPVFERVKYGFAHLKKGETVMEERTGPAWGKRYVGVTYDWLCRCLNPPKAGTLLLTDGTKVVAPTPAKPDRSSMEEETPLPTLTQTLLATPTSNTVDWTDNLYVTTCVRFIESTLRPLEADPQRFHRVATAIAHEILGEMENLHDCTATNESELTAAT